MFDWLIDLAKWLYKEFWPVRIVHSYQQGVRFHNGEDKALLKTGIHFFWPATGSIEIECVVEDVANLTPQTLTTADEVTITIDGSVAYKIVNIRKWFTQVTDFHQSLNGKCERHLARVVRNEKFKDLVSSQDLIEENLRKEISAAVENWGVKILDVGLTSFSKTPAYRIYGTLPPSTNV